MLRTLEVFQLSASAWGLSRGYCQGVSRSDIVTWRLNGGGGSTSATWHSSLPKWWQMLAGWQHELLTTGIFPYIRFNILITEQLASPRGSGPWSKAGVWMASVTLSWKFMFHHFWDSLLTTQAIPVHKISFSVWDQTLQGIGMRRDPPRAILKAIHQRWYNSSRATKVANLPTDQVPCVYRTYAQGKRTQIRPNKQQN